MRRFFGKRADTPGPGPTPWDAKSANREAKGFPAHQPDHDRGIADAKKIRDAGKERWGIVALALTLTALAMIVGYLMKRNCLAPYYRGNYQYTRNCYSDIIFLYGRDNKPFTEPGKDTPFSRHGLAYRDNNSEYPPLTGLFISAVNSPVAEGDVGGFLRANAFGLSVFALAGAAALALIARDRKRLALYAVAPAMLSYAFHSWDLLAVGFMIFALWAYTRERDALAGAMLGLGAATKVFPALAVPVLMLARRRSGGRPGPIFGQAVLWFLIPNVIVMAFAGFGGWWFPWKFQSERLPNFETVWYFILHHGQGWFKSLGNDFWFGTAGGVAPFARVAQSVSLLLLIAGVLLLLWRESRRDDYRPIATCFGLVIIFLLTTKVFSPQYAIWLLPFFVLVRVPWHAFVAYVVGDLLVLAAIWAYFAASIDKTAQPWHLGFLEATVYFRYATLAYLLYWTRKAEDLAGDATPVQIGSASAVWAGDAPSAV